ncbi:zinc finger FYVE domain-containing protein 1-like [Nesidiocoris tenuis]|uniref:Zinc finger FYVE domain-containing protein 1-like n=1 Tax=Nesidiocoris tenuis TaxID=355587 RepID=A0ABN7AQ03_9HEMI|nr:zinc finger FYVE domain-containing protein 1-like [Nesidiocoris tenuis]
MAEHLTNGRLANVSPALMEPLDTSFSLISIGTRDFDSSVEKADVSYPKKRLSSMPDVTLTAEFTSLRLGSVDDNENTMKKAFQLINPQERLNVGSVEEFLDLLGCDSDIEKVPRVKVVSIVGNTGDGKSHTLNHCFFNGDEVFRTSPAQESCTIGVWAAYDPELQIVCLDTEGLMGSAKLADAHHRARLLVKILGVSDLVIYRTRSARLHENMFTFLGRASRHFANHLQSCLESIWQKVDMGGSISALGPAVIIFHETLNTKPLPAGGIPSPEDYLRLKFQELGLNVDAFSSLKYLGQTGGEGETSYSQLYGLVKAELNNTNVRSPRSPAAVFHVLKALNDRFNGTIVSQEEVIPDSYFTCPAFCQSCKSRCTLSMGHQATGTAHHTPNKCRYQHQFENLYYVCKTCHANGNEVRVEPHYSSSTENSWFEVITHYAWSGYVIECPHCGEIYRSRQYWYGNIPPENGAVRTEIHHVWPGAKCAGSNNQVSAQKVLDSVSYLTGAVMSASQTPTKALGSWMTDQVAPKYWRPNAEITNCIVCQKVFTASMTKHHCRMCGEGVCDNCSKNSKPVPERGWYSPARVCDTCFCPPSTKKKREETGGNVGVDEKEVIPRKVGEAVVSTISSVASILTYPKSE